MQVKSLVFAVLLVAGVSGCGSSDKSPPAVQNVYVSASSVSAGTQILASVTLRVSATKAGNAYRTDAISSVISLPVGATYLTGTSYIIGQGLRDPDSITTCGDGRTVLSYNFAPGEIDDSYHFAKFSAAISFNLILDTPANDNLLIAGAEALPPADPCGPITGESIKFRVG